MRNLPCSKWANWDVRGGQRMDEVTADYESDLVDLSDIALPELLDSDNTVLANALRRVLTEVDQEQDPVAGFSSGI
jgi:FXSXX-COOH protein